MYITTCITSHTYCTRADIYISNIIILYLASTLCYTVYICLRIG